ncbi:MAG: nickel pincer cofactor biosynthesis protein LarB [Nitrolancea sp.]
MSTERPSDRVLGDLMQALTNGAHTNHSGSESQVVADPGRSRRKGIPEVVYAPNKSIAQLERAVTELIDPNGRVVVSRITEDETAELDAILSELESEQLPGSWTAIFSRPGAPRPSTGGRVAIFAAGTSDWPAAHEARVVAEEMGCHVDLIVDVGVAGLHRLFGPLREVLDSGVDAIVVAAGMDGALPSVMAGLVPVPVIGLPTSVGYGYGGNGQAALMSMLQSCAPGLTVVNIDNSIGAGSTAALIANSVARARSQAR